jgi:hypothetical protein
MDKAIPASALVKWVQEHIYVNEANRLNVGGSPP